jgi:hypothetical protein
MVIDRIGLVVKLFWVEGKLEHTRKNLSTYFARVANLVTAYEEQMGGCVFASGNGKFAPGIGTF